MRLAAFLLPPCWATPPAPSPRPPAPYAELHQVSTYGCTTHYFGYDRGTCALDGDRILLTQQQRSLDKGRAGAFACQDAVPFGIAECLRSNICGRLANRHAGALDVALPAVQCA